MHAATNKFHRRCGDRVTLLNYNTTAVRNFVEFNHGLILGHEPLKDDVMFEVKIDRKVNVWNGSLEIGVTTLDPESMELPATATKLRNTAWILSGNSIVKDGVTLLNGYGPELDSLSEDDCVGVSRTSKGELIFYINGRSLGVAAKDLPPRLFPVIDLYGQCVQVTVAHRNYSTPAIDSTNQLEEYLEEESDRFQQAEAAAWAVDEDEPRDTYIEMPIVCPLVSRDHLRFHPRCGILVKLSYNNKTAERARPLDDYNNGVVMTHRPLYDNELFEIRIDRLVDKWSGSIEVGVTSHNPATIRFPSTMTNMDSGTIMMSGCKVLLNGHGTCMEYGNFNLDELREGDTVGMMRKSNGKLHYFINGIDQGVATDKVAQQVWGVIDLYGMTVKVTIVDPCEDLDSNINRFPIRELTAPQLPLPVTSSQRPGLDEETILFHTLRDSNVIIINDGKTAHRPNAFEFFNNGIVMTNRTLKTNELFQVRLDLVIPKWAGSIEIGVTRQSSKDIKIPFKMSNKKSGAWAMIGEDVVKDGTVITPQYVTHLNQLAEGDTVGVMRTEMGILHFYVKGVDQGPAAYNIPEHVFAVIDLYGRVAQATIIDVLYIPPQPESPDTPISSESNATVFPEICFHRVHGRNARLSRNRLTASRTTVYSEFNDAVLFSSRPLRECDLFEIRIEKMVDCWIGSLEIGVTAIRPDDLEAGGGVGAIAGTATDLTWDTYILSGAAMMKDGECVRSGYPLDLDTLTEGSRVGIMWHADRSLHYYLDGMDMGKAWYVPHLNIYAVVDLYGQCAQVSIVQTGDRNYNYNGCNLEHHVKRPPRGPESPPPPYWSLKDASNAVVNRAFSEYCGDNVILRYNYSFAQRMNIDPMGAIIFSAHHLAVDDIYEIQIHECKYMYAGSFRMGVTDVNILNANINRHFPPTIQWLPHYTAYIDGRYMKYSQPGSRVQKVQHFIPSFEWLRQGDRIGFKKTADSRVLIYYNSELLDVTFENVPDKVYVVFELGGHITMIKSVARGAPAVQPDQFNTKTDSNTMAEVQQNYSSFDANATDNATGQSIISASAAMVAATAVVTSESVTTEIDTSADETAKPTIRMLVPPTLIGARVVIPNYNTESDKPECPTQQNAEFLPSAPTMEALEMGMETEAVESMATDEPSNESNEPDPQLENEEHKGDNTAEVGEAAAAAPVVDYAVAGPSHANVAEAVPAEPTRQMRPRPYAFHHIHGRNIRLCSSDTVAMRTRSHADAVAYASQPLRRGNYFRFRIDKISDEWQGTLCIGAVASLPKRAPPRSALHIDVPAWIVTNDVLLARGRCNMSEFARKLDSISENSVITLHFKYNSELTLEIDGTLVGAISMIPRMFTYIFPTIDLYGRVIQVSILLHPHGIVGGSSLDLPVIDENFREEYQDIPDDEGYGGDDDDDDESPENEANGHRGNPSRQHLNEWRNKKRANKSRQTTNNDEDYGNNPGPSRRPDFLPGLPTSNDVQNHQIKSKRTIWPYRKSMHLSLVLPNNSSELQVSDNDEAAKLMAGVRRSMSTEQFARPAEDSGEEKEEEAAAEEEEEEDDEDENSLINALSLGSHIFDDDDDSLDVPEICDTNIRHNDRYPEASCHDADLLDNELVDAMTLDAGNLPDLTEEQSPSIDESTRRDDFWADGLMHFENLTYLNNLINYTPEEGRPRFAERDWVFYSESNGNCEHMHLALKYWNYLVLPYPDMREVVASGQVRCFCDNCQPEAEPAFAGWVRIERANASGSGHVFWHLVRSTLVSASALTSDSGVPMRRPSVLVSMPTTNPSVADIWFDEEGKPHHTVIALVIDTSSGPDPANDRLIAYMIYLRSNCPFNEQDTSADRDSNSFDD